MLKENYEIARSITKDNTYMDMLTEEKAKRFLN
jgi:hypothetical protein